MDNVVIPWLQGEGNIVIEFNGRGNDSASVRSDTRNQGLDRSQEVSYKTTGGSPQEVVTQVINQAGRREIFNVVDGSFNLSGGGTFNVIK